MADITAQAVKELRDQPTSDDGGQEGPDRSARR